MEELYGEFWRISWWSIEDITSIVFVIVMFLLMTWTAED